MEYFSLIRQNIPVWSNFWTHALYVWGAADDDHNKQWYKHAGWWSNKEEVSILSCHRKSCKVIVTGCHVRQSSHKVMRGTDHIMKSWPAVHVHIWCAEYAVNLHVSSIKGVIYLASPLKNFPMAMKSSWSEQLNTTHWIANALARSCMSSHDFSEQNM